jgi:hypothetical protein
MVKAVFSNAKGLVQSAGANVNMENGVAFSGTQTISAPAAAAATAASTISTTVSFVTVSNATNANDRIYLPSPTDVETGHRILIHATEEFELCAKGDGTTATTINGVAVTNAGGDAAAELAINNDRVLLCVKNGANAWLVIDLGGADLADPDSV